MSRRATTAAAVLGALFLAAFATHGDAAADAPVEVALVAPEGGSPVFGEVEMVAEVYPSGAIVDRLEFYVDGLRVGVLEEPPWRVIAEAGERNAEHLFEVVAFAPDGSTATSRIGTPRLRTDLEIDVELQQLYVTVERRGERVLDLAGDDFTVLDDGVPQSIVTFEHGDVPFTAAVLVDSSISMRGPKLPTALAGARTFVREMKPLDEAKLVLFADRVRHETPFTNFSSVLALGLQGIEAGGGTAINDSLYLAYKRLEPRQGRKVVVLLSDGIDVESVLPMERVLWLARMSQAVLYWIRLPRPGENTGEDWKRYTAWRSAAVHQRELDRLRETVAESGGRVVTISAISEVEAAFRTLLTELRQQYVIGYYPSTRHGNGVWHDIEVEVEGRGMDVRTRRGYLER